MNNSVETKVEGQEELTEEQTEFETNEQEFEMVMPDGAKSFINLYENVLNDEMCDKLVELFENAEDYHDNIDDEGFRKWTELNLFNTELLEEFPELQSLAFKVLEKVQYMAECYRRYYNIEFFPTKASNEQIRMKRYDVDDGNFGYHTDVGDLKSAKRFLVTMFYLNDVEEGGETVFPDYKLGVTPAKGSLLVFPPFWTHPHQAEKPKSNAKYILSTYLHYLPEETVEETTE